MSPAPHLTLTAVALSSSLVFLPRILLAQIVEGFPLHAVQSAHPETAPCDIGDPCNFGPTTSVLPRFFTAVYLSTRNVGGQISAVQTAFDWEPGTWQLLFGEWNCLPNQLVIREPSGPGPIDGTLLTTFDCVSFGEFPIIGRLYMIPGSGCLRQVRSGFQYGTHVMSCLGQPWEIEPPACGAICVNEPGLDACWPQAVESATWGCVKAQYRDATR
jgi:hypothetical protein